MKKIDWNKPIQFEKGAPVTFVGEYKNKHGEKRFVVANERNGSLYISDEYGSVDGRLARVVNVKEALYVNIYKTKEGRLFSESIRTLKDDKQYEDLFPRRLVARIKVVEGQFDE